MSSLRSAALICTIFSLVSLAKAEIAQPSANQLFGISAAYNDVIFGDYYARSGDIEGHAAIKGNADVQSHAFGSGEQNLHSRETGPTLVVGGNLTAASSGLYDGDAYVGGSLIGSKWNTVGTFGTGPYNSVDPSYQGTPGMVYVANAEDKNLDTRYQKSWATAGITSLPFDFTVAEQQLRTVSSDLFQLSNTVTVDNFVNSYKVDLTGKSGLQVVTINASYFGKNIYIDAGSDTTLIINVLDDTNGLLTLTNGFVINGITNPFYGDFDGSNILINTDVSNVNISSVALNASLMALDAHVSIQHGNIDGQTFAASASLTNGGEFHAYYTFDDQHFPPGGGSPATTPEPASCLILGLGLVGLAYYRRRQSAAQTVIAA